MAISNTVAGCCAQLLRIILTFTRPYSDYILDFLYHLFMGKTKPLPPIENNLLLMSAEQLAKKIRKRQLKCEDLMRAYVQRSRLVHPLINAAVDARYEEALKDAQTVDRFLEGEKSEEEIERDTPLLGIPFSCKEAIGVKDLIQTSGLVWAKGHKAKQDSDSAALYRKAGAIPVTVTNVPETCLWWESSNLLHGMTKNPYDNARTVGGSSGGESALITSGGALIGIGNDLAGSIRIPASFCGIYGHKPTTGIVSNYGSFPYCEMGIKNEKVDAIVSTGPMCRYVEDIPLLMKVLTNNDKRLRLDDKVDFRKVKIYYIEEIPGILHKSVPAVKEAVKKAANYFKEEYGVQPVPLYLEELEYGFSIWECKLLETGVPPMKGLLELKSGKINLWCEFFKSLFRCADHTWPAIYNAMVDRREKNQFYHECLKKHDELCRKFAEIFSEDAVILMPTHPEPPPHYLMTIPKYPNIGYTCIFSIQGFPSTQIPAGLCNGLPIGLQAISGKLKDRLTIAAALELDKVFGGWKSPCPINI